MTLEINLSQKVAVVTGAATGIGRECAFHLAHAGAYRLRLYNSLLGVWQDRGLVDAAAMCCKSSGAASACWNSHRRFDGDNWT